MSNCFERAFQRRLDSADSWTKAQAKALRAVPTKKKLLMIGIPLLFMVLSGVFLVLAHRTETLSSRPKTGFPDSILSGSYDWPDGADLDGIAEIDGYAVVYSDKSCFAVFRDGVLHHMLDAHGHTCGIADDRIFLIYNGTAYLYDAEGKLVQTADASAFRNTPKYNRSEAVVSSYTYRIRRTFSRNTVVVESDGEETTLLIQRRFIRTLYCTAACICFMVAFIVGLIGLIKLNKATKLVQSSEQTENKKPS